MPEQVIERIPVDNMQKYENYKRMHEDLTKAIKHEFYYQAIFIEYAILEDRMTSLLKHAQVPYINKKGQEITIKDKINKVQDRPEFSCKYVRSRISIDLLNQVREWTKNRNDLIHHLANIPYDDASVKEIAIAGKELVRIVSGKVSSINRYHQKQITLGESRE